MATRNGSSGDRVIRARDVALKKLPADPGSDRGKELRRRVRQVAEAFQELDTRVNQRRSARSRSAELQKTERRRRRAEAESTLAELEKQFHASRRNGDAALVAQVGDQMTAARGHLMLIDSVTRNNEQTDRQMEEQDQNLLASASGISVAAIESVYRTDGGERFEAALKGAVAVGTIAGGFAYPVLTAAVSAAQAAIDLFTGSSTSRRLRKEEAVAARQEAALVFLKTAEELLKSG